MKTGIIFLLAFLSIANETISSETPVFTNYSDHIGWFNLQWPPKAEISAGNNLTVYVRCWQPEVTALPGPDARISVWIGYSTSNTQPWTWTNWIPATFNVQYDQVDEYMASFGASLPQGIYYYTSRIQYNGGSYQYGGYNEGGGGLWDGQYNVSGVLAVGKKLATVTQNDTIRYFNGQPKPVKVTTDPPGLSVQVLYNGSTLPPTDTGNYTITATVNDPVYQGRKSGILTIYTLPADEIAADLRKRLIWVMYDQVYYQSDMDHALSCNPDVINRGWFKWGNWSGFNWNQWNWMAEQAGNANALLGGGGTVMALYPDEASDDKIMRMVERNAFNEPMHFLENSQLDYYCGDFQNTEYLDFLLSWMVDQIDAGAGTLHLDGIAEAPAVNTGYSDYSMSQFSRYLKEKYVDRQGWTINDVRWNLIFDISFPEDCTDGTINTFDYRKYLYRNGYSTSPSYANFTLKYEFGFPYFYKGTYSDLRNERACRYLYESVKDYASEKGKDVTFTTNGMSKYVDYQTTGVWNNWQVNDRKINVEPCYIPVWRSIKNSSIRYHKKDLPLVVFHDWGYGMPFLDELPPDEQILWLRIYAPEIFASGSVFAWPYAGGGKLYMTPDAVLDTMKSMISWYDSNRNIYLDAVWADDQHVNLAGQDKLTATVLTRQNVGGETEKKFIHLINRKLGNNREPLYRSDFSIRVSSPAPVSVWAVSPDFTDFQKLDYSLSGDSADLVIKSLEAYTVVVLDYKNKMPQRIHFNDLPVQKTGNPDYDPKITSSSGLPVTCTSSDASVATIVNGKIHITGEGTCTITASQPGNNDFSPAEDVVRTLVVSNTVDMENLSDPSGYLYPNPFSDAIYINSGIPARVKIFDITGKICYTGSSVNGRIEPGYLSPGLYFLETEGKIFKVVKK